MKTPGRMLGAFWGVQQQGLGVFVTICFCVGRNGANYCGISAALEYLDIIRKFLTQVSCQVAVFLLYSKRLRPIDLGTELTQEYRRAMLRPMLLNNVQKLAIEG